MGAGGGAGGGTRKTAPMQYLSQKEVMSNRFSKPMTF